MKIALKITKWLFITLGVVLVALLILMQFVDFSPSEEEMKDRFAKVPYNPLYQTIQYGDRDIHYVDIGDTEKPLVVFVHGSPGSWDAFLSQLTDTSLLDKFRMISVDRPGFGKSGYGKPERSVVEQAAALCKVIEMSKPAGPVLLVGHSYGGPVIARMAMDKPELIDGLVIVAGSIDPKLEKTKWFQIPVHYKILSWVLPGLIYSSNEEIIALKDELDLMMPYWEDVTIPVEVIQGEKDKLVPAGNADFAKKMIPEDKLVMTRIDDMNHFVPWTRPDLIRNALFNMIAEISTESSSELQN